MQKSWLDLSFIKEENKNPMEERIVIGFQSLTLD